VHIQTQVLGHVVPVFTVGQDRNRQTKNLSPAGCEIKLRSYFSKDFWQRLPAKHSNCSVQMIR
jgi:hypothetical protein